MTAPGAFERGTDGPRVILVGVDGSPTSLRAAAYAAGLARRQHSRLVAVYVTGATTPMAGWVPAAEVAAREASAAVDAELRQLTERADELGIEAEYRTVHGDPVAELTRIADALPADAVLVGASEQAGHRVVGSVAVRLVRVGRWPVTVVP
ncbi:universal stress protein [Modestobacter versicolor]|uniref:Nucleotide-binding universal stress UspA family protein n=1 Tax=Modestobacter versicolor TaxID=429133 RepID=A0A323V9Q6_9ACTN|nr:universal stress protein [Modestobacter versicolor]MBB3677131.1 nucleotide-binding universal stress UspA family protein [Modestobacter versicolor]PZA21577.1 universal stress protein [Modestobacter versicolor]